MNINIAVMAGGQSRRFDSDKTLEIFGGKPLIAHPVDRLSSIASKVIVVAKDCGKYNFLGVPCIQDSYDVQCPMVGILTALKYFGEPFFTVAADVPFVDPEHVLKLFAGLKDADAAMPVIDGKKHPLYACYGLGVMADFEAAVQAGDYSLMKRLENLNVNCLENEDLFNSENEKKSFININTRQEYDSAIKYIGVSDG